MTTEDKRASVKLQDLITQAGRCGRFLVLVDRAAPDGDAGLFIAVRRKGKGGRLNVYLSIDRMDYDATVGRETLKKDLDRPFKNTTVEEFFATLDLDDIRCISDRWCDKIMFSATRQKIV